MNRLVGVLLVTLFAVVVGLNAIFARISYDAGADPVTFLFMRFLIALPIMFLIMKKRGFAIPRGKLLLALILIGSLSAGTLICFFVSIQLAPVNLVIIITYLYPAIVTVLSALILRQKITGIKTVALVIATVGILLAIGIESGGYAVGIVLAAATAVLHSIYLVCGSVLVRRAGTFSAATIFFVTAVVIFGLMTAVQGPQWPVNRSGWLAIIASALVSTVLGRIVFYEGIQRIDISNASIICTFEVVVTVALSVVVLGESLSLLKMVGAALVIASVIMLARSEYVAAHTRINPAVSR